MKKFIVAAGFIVAIVAFASPAYSQIKNRVGAMISFTGGDVDETGLGLVGEFGVAKKVSIAPQLIFYFPDNFDFFELNVNANYYFFSQNVFEFYGMGGLNFARVGYEDAAGDNHSDTELGLNLGIGSNFQLGGRVVPFAELRFTLGEYDQVALGLGVKVNLK